MINRDSFLRRSLHAFAWLMLMCASAQAQQTGGILFDHERARIAAVRQSIQEEFDRTKLQCQKKFAVNDCIKAAQAERRQRTDQLRREELMLNDQERKHRAAQQAGRIEARIKAKSVQEERKQEEPAQIRLSARPTRVDGSNTDAVKEPAASEMGVSGFRPERSTQTEMEKAKHYEEKRQAAERRKQKLEQSRTSKNAKPLPVPQ